MPSVSGLAEKVSTGFGLWESVDPSAKPAPLVTFAPTANASIAWQANAGEAGNFVFFPGIDTGGVYAAGAGGAMAKFSPASGVQTWRVDAEQPLSAGVGTGGDLQLIATPKGDVLAYDTEGKLRWKVSLRSEILAPPRVADGIVVVRTADARLFGLDAVDGKRKWVYARPNPALTVRSAASVVIYRGAVFAGFAGGRLVALKLPTGLVGWETAVALPKGTTELERVTDVTSDPVLDDKQVCAVAFQGRLACFDILRGTLIWARDVSSYAGLSMDNRHVYVTDDKGAVYAFGKEQGASVWKQDKLFARRVTAPQVVGAFVAVGDFEGYVHFLNRDDGSFAARLPTDGSAIAASPKRLDDKLVVQTRKGGLFAISVQ
jgi:outer membrane protein assembly factor BamB